MARTSWTMSLVSTRPVGLFGEQTNVSEGCASRTTRRTSSMGSRKSSSRWPTAIVVPVTSPIWECMA